MGTNKTEALKKLVRDFMGYTTAHGIGRIADSKRTFLKLFWVLACLGAFTMFIIQVQGLFKLFLSRPVTTKVKITFEKSLPFPAVTVCNLNMLRKSLVPDGVKREIEKDYGSWNDSEKTTTNKDEFRSMTFEDNSTKLINQTDYSTDEKAGEPTGSRRKRSSSNDDDSSNDKEEYGTTAAPKDKRDTDKGWSEWNKEKYFGEEEYGSDRYSPDVIDEYPDPVDLDKNTRMRIKVADIIAATNPRDLFKRGHSFKKMIQNCTWKGLNCLAGNLSDHWSFSWNYKYGNCFTWNGGRNWQNKEIRVLTTSKPGPSQGLSLSFNIEQGQYIGPLTVEAGIRVLLHDQGVMPFPYEEGFSISPGMATSVGIKKTKIIRLDRFNNNSCLAAHKLSTTNIYRKHHNITVYSQQACLNSCLGVSQWKTCNCSEAAYPSDGYPCDTFNEKTAKCLRHVKSLFTEDKLDCLSECRQPCTEEIILKTISSSQWPSKAYLSLLMDTGDEKFNSDNMLQLNVFFNEMNHEEIEESFSYAKLNLLADIGGQLGLWIGISALTCCELLELLIQIFKLLFQSKVDNQNKNVHVIKVAPQNEKS